MGWGREKKKRDTLDLVNHVRFAKEHKPDIVRLEFPFARYKRKFAQIVTLLAHLESLFLDSDPITQKKRKHPQLTRLYTELYNFLENEWAPEISKYRSFLFTLLNEMPETNGFISFWLGLCYGHGWGTQENKQKAEYWLKSSALDFGYGWGQWAYGRHCLVNGLDLETAISFFHRSRNQNCPAGWFESGLWIYNAIPNSSNSNLNSSNSNNLNSSNSNNLNSSNSNLNSSNSSSNSSNPSSNSSNPSSNSSNSNLNSSNSSNSNSEMSFESQMSLAYSHFSHSATLHFKYGLLSQAKCLKLGLGAQKNPSEATKYYQMAERPRLWDAWDAWVLGRRVVVLLCCARKQSACGVWGNLPWDMFWLILEFAGLVVR